MAQGDYLMLEFRADDIAVFATCQHQTTQPKVSRLPFYTCKNVPVLINQASRMLQLD